MSCFQIVVCILSPLLRWQCNNLIRRAAFKPVLPPHLHGLTKLPAGKHAEIFGDDLPARQKELQTKADLAASLVKPPPPPPTKTYPSYQHARRKNKPYSRPTANVTQSYKPLGETRPLPRVKIRHVYHPYRCFLTQALWQFLKVCGP